MKQNFGKTESVLFENSFVFDCQILKNYWTKLSHNRIITSFVNTPPGTVFT
jgi:hypothetical protein